MMMYEFTERTGFQPTADEYEQIEQAYYDFDGDKNAFCKAFVDNGGEMKIYKARAEEIERLRSQMLEIEKEHKKEVADRDRRINELTAELDRELEWKPSTGTGTNMEQSRYEKLTSSGRVMTDEEAKAFIADECGFAPEKIRILHEANTYEVNKHLRLRVAATFDRAPVYDATDWNYVRFDCASFMYELVNGELQFYCC
ncbi:MAG: hypothetical protein ACLSAF_22175 [Intestinimonas sp.]